MLTKTSGAEDYSILDTGDEKDFNDLTTLASAICQTPIALINLFDEKRQSVKSLIVSNIAKSALEQSFSVPDISAEQDILIVEDAASDERFLPQPYINEKDKITFFAGVPLVNDDGVMLGSLSVIDRQQKSLTPEQINALKIIAKQVVDKLELRKKAIVSEDTIRELRYSNLFMQKFNAMAAHDIKNPMSSILLSAQSLKFRLQRLQDADCERLADLNISSTKRLMTLLDDMLAYSKSPSLLLTKKVKIDLHELLMAVVGMVSIPENFTVILPEEKHSLYISSVAVQQIFINLLTNAIRYNDKAQGRLQIRFREDDDYLYFEAEDNGIGIDKAYHEKIFNNSFTLKIADRFEKKGSGIGLSTVKELIKALNGKIVVKSVPGNGATFYLNLSKK
ncbi:ATP-binding protein [Mucilaginibacter sp. RCC_168]|uniref:sensor histidine kinase n=1 Tax=Mucilaginibacter sp. RCC_168 TaxID=3239221 RepID=UPI003523B00C